MLSVAVGGCTPPAPGQNTPFTENAKLPKGPPIEDIVTPFDHALNCLSGKIPAGATFAVGNIEDSTGKQQLTDMGSGKFVTSGAGDIVQSALFRAGVQVVNRRDPSIGLLEHNWGIRNLQDLAPADFYITGSINSLDFIPGGGYDVEIAGIGPRKRQNRVLVGLDLALTNAYDGRVVANVPLQKQIFTSEIGWATNRFFGKGLVILDSGGMTREATQLALREMLSYATLDLLTQVTDNAATASCLHMVSASDGSIMDAADFTRPKSIPSLSAMLAESKAAEAKILAAGPAGNGAAGGPHAQGRPGQSPAKARELANAATAYAAHAISDSDNALRAKSYAEALPIAKEATAYMNAAVKQLREAAKAGLTGPEGDAAATLVQQAVAATQAAQKQVLARPDAPAQPDAPAATPSAAAPAQPAAPVTTPAAPAPAVAAPKPSETTP